MNSYESVLPELPASMYGDADSSFESVPPNTQLPISNPLSLKQYAQRQLCKHVDFFNAIQMLVFAERTFSDDLASFTAEFIQMNLDAVLIHARPKDLTYLLDDFLISWEKLASFKKISSKSTEKYHAKYHSSKGSGSIDETVKPRGDSFDECTLRERTKSVDLETYSSALKAIKSIRKKLNSVKEIEAAVQKGAVLSSEQYEKLKRKAPLESELRRLEPILKRLEAEESIRQAAQLRRSAAASIVDNVQVSPPSSGHHKRTAAKGGSPPVLVESTVAAKIDAPDKPQAPSEPSASSTKLPSFNEWSAVSAAANPTSLASQRKTAWKTVPTGASTSVIEILPTYATPSKPTVPKGVVNSHSAPSPSPDERGSLTLAAFLTPPASKRLGGNVAKESSNAPRGWNNSLNSKSPVSLHKIQLEEENIRSNSSMGDLKGHNSPWFVERSLRPDSFGDIIESQQRQSDQELMERKALIAAEEAARRVREQKNRTRTSSMSAKKT